MRDVSKRVVQSIGGALVVGGTVVDTGVCAVAVAAAVVCSSFLPLK